ncbi:hypothetical protein IFM89_032558 [Coptis chinensis]|uniref:Uncharacterized protein n=1 Tax=Coptis chinensis TaxID=261450 RepID=A0A835M071_9MAGN|nr:hypothetical protein IFM89_032558 [Coptis chinensis]
MANLTGIRESRRGQPNESRELESFKSVGWNTIKSSSESPRTGNWNSLESQETPQMEPSDPRVKKAEETKAGGWSGNDRHTQGQPCPLPMKRATSDLVEYSKVTILFIFHSLLSFCKYVLYFSSPTLALLLKPMRKPRVIAEIIMLSLRNAGRCIARTIADKSHFHHVFLAKLEPPQVFGYYFSQHRSSLVLLPRSAE